MGIPPLGIFRITLRHMYYPKTKIITDLSTDGTELIYIDTEVPYVGKYHILSNGNITTGKHLKTESRGGLNQPKSQQTTIIQETSPLRRI